MAQPGRLSLALGATADHLEARVAEVLAAFPLAAPQWQPLGRGNINDTFAVSAEGVEFVLQRLNPIFSPAVHYDIEAVTAHLQHKGVRTPRLVRSQTGELWVADSEQRAWRLFDRIEGESHARATNPDQVREAGALAARFHRALFDLDYTFQSRRPGVHDTERHQEHLKAMLAAHGEHPAFSEAAEIAEQIVAALKPLLPLGAAPARVVHGDMKLDNIIFSPAGEAVCFVDLDTVSSMSIPLELGDAFRSWCNPSGEDGEHPRFDMAYFEAGLAGYAEEAGDALDSSEVQGLAPAIETIMLELAARFCGDALAESYFGWDRTRYAAAWQHNLVRATGQLRLAQSFAAQRHEATAVVLRLLG